MSNEAPAQRKTGTVKPAPLQPQGGCIPVPYCTQEYTDCPVSILTCLVDNGIWVPQNSMSLLRVDYE